MSDCSPCLRRRNTLSSQYHPKNKKYISHTHPNPLTLTHLRPISAPPPNTFKKYNSLYFVVTASPGDGDSAGHTYKGPPPMRRRPFFRLSEALYASPSRRAFSTTAATTKAVLFGTFSRMRMTSSDTLKVHDLHAVFLRPAPSLLPPHLGFSV